MSHNLFPLSKSCHVGLFTFPYQINPQTPRYWKHCRALHSHVCIFLLKSKKLHTVFPSHDAFSCSCRKPIQSPSVTTATLLYFSAVTEPCRLHMKNLVCNFFKKRLFIHISAKGLPLLSISHHLSIVPIPAVGIDDLAAQLQPCSPAFYLRLSDAYATIQTIYILPRQPICTIS